MSKSTTYEGDSDDVVATTISTNTVTVGFGRKMGRENYGNEEASIFFQVDITEDDDLVSIEQKVKSTYAFAKTVVLAELGVDSVENDEGIIRDVPQAAAPKAASGARKATGATKKASGGGGRSSGGGGSDKTAMWQHWLDNPNDWWDNRDGKRNPKAPDFKGKQNTPYADEGLWINSKDLPEFVTVALEFDAEAA